MMDIPFNRPFHTTRSLALVEDALARGHVSGNGHYTGEARARLCTLTGAREVLLTTSCTAALEMSALLAGIEPGDEVIVPSFTFVSTVNAFVLHGATPRFIDIRPDTLNIDEQQLEAAIGDRTKALVVVHYAGVGCEMTAVQRIVDRHGLFLVEDAAHGLGAIYGGRPLGTFGSVGDAVVPRDEEHPLRRGRSAHRQRPEPSSNALR